MLDPRNLNEEEFEANGVGSSPDVDDFIAVPDSVSDEDEEQEETTESGVGTAPEEDDFQVMPESFFEERKHEHEKKEEHHGLFSFLHKHEEKPEE